MAFLEEKYLLFKKKHKAATEPVARKQAGYGENRQGELCYPTWAPGSEDPAALLSSL